MADRQAFPTADDLLPPVLALAPRGAAWGTEEAGDGKGASPIMRQFWRAVAGWAADVNRRDFDLAVQTFPSAITWSLPDWESEYGLPDTCTTGQGGTDARTLAVRGRFAAVGGSSPAYFVCLAKSAGYDITIEEPTQFLIDVSELAAQSVEETWFVPDDSLLGDGGDPIEGFTLSTSVDDADQVAGGLVETWFAPDDGEIGSDGDALESWSEAPGGTVWKTWVVHVVSYGESWFRPSDPSVVEDWFTPDGGELAADPIESFTLAASPGDGSEIGAQGDPLEGFTPAADLECLLRRGCPTHTELIFNYSAAA